MTYVKSIGLSDNSTTVYVLCPRSFFSAQQMAVIGRSLSPNRGHKRDGQNELCKLTFEELRILNGVKMVQHCSSQHKNIEPSTTNDWSNRVWLVAELNRLLEGMNLLALVLAGRQTRFLGRRRFYYEEISTY